MTTSTSTQEKAQQTAATAADETKKVAGTAASEAQNVAAEAKAQAASLVDEATTQVKEQAGTQRDRLVSTLNTFSSDLDQMVSAGSASGLAADLARQLAERTRSLGSHMDGREPADLLDDVRRFARRRPGTFLLGALAAGVVAGRLARGAKADTGQSQPTLSPAPTPAPVTATVGAAVPSPVPAPTPAYGDAGLAAAASPQGARFTGDPLTDPLSPTTPTHVAGRDGL